MSKSQVVLQLRLDFVNQKNRINRALFGRLKYACKQLLLIEELLAAALFNNENLQHFKHFEGGEALLALQALTAATNAVALNGGARVDYLAFRKTTTGTFHNCFPMRPTARTLLFSKIHYLV